VFVLAFFFRSVRGTAAFWGMLVGEAFVFAAFKFTEISFLWYNVIGCAVVILTALAITRSQFNGGRGQNGDQGSGARGQEPVAR
jgi:hypothetical protein